MKKSPFIGLLLLLVVVCTLSCDRSKEGDYIEKYLGNWDFEIIKFSRNTDLGTESLDSSYYQGVIFAGAGEHEVMIQYSDKYNFKVIVSEDGGIRQECMQPTFCVGSFPDENTFDYKMNNRTFDGKYFWSHGMYIKGVKVKGASASKKNTGIFLKDFIASSFVCGARIPVREL